MLIMSKSGSCAARLAARTPKRPPGAKTRRQPCLERPRDCAYNDWQMVSVDTGICGSSGKSARGRPGDLLRGLPGLQLLLDSAAQHHVEAQLRRGQVALIRVLIARRLPRVRRRTAPRRVAIDRSLVLGSPNEPKDRLAARSLTGDPGTKGHSGTWARHATDGRVAIHRHICQAPGATAGFRPGPHPGCPHQSQHVPRISRRRSAIDGFETGRNT
jgi:hypothetical protein